MPSTAQRLIDGATPEMLRKLPSAAKSLCSALRGMGRGPTLQTIVASGRIEPWLLSVTLSPIAIRPVGRSARAEEPCCDVDRRRICAAPTRGPSQAHARQQASRFGPHAGQNRRPGLGLVRGDQGWGDHAGQSPTGRASPNTTSLISSASPAWRQILSARSSRVASLQR
jgi:hypothetical protein